MNQAHPRRIDWLRVAALVGVIASGVVMAIVIYGLVWLALAVLG